MHMVSHVLPIQLFIGSHAPLARHARHEGITGPGAEVAKLSHRRPVSEERSEADIATPPYHHKPARP
ncbi:hypothetical protein PGTUg99_008752 [Puccinia graminis f. sp. tritici]|uniref:Uncharacterized protein n=1 Tax=Puccinia graminis f. sp. tritici TaxID=56615 RepID=A0A5B0MRK8_PUCGR|nr:hypothetical protein PGTUg99_008752 [Puccinia graminis f. sp. tritici]